MSKSKSIELIELASKELGLPYVPGDHGGGHRIMIGLWYLCQSEKKSILAYELKDAIESLRSGRDGRPNPRRDPLGFLLGAAPLYDYDVWCASTKPLCISEFNDFFVHLVREHLSILTETCEVNQVGLLLPNLDATLANRLWQQTIFLTAMARHNSISGSHLQITKQALNAIHNSGQKNIRKRLNSNWASPTIHRRTGGPKTLTDLYKKLAISYPDEMVARWIKWDPSPATRTNQGVKKPVQKSFGDMYFVPREGDLGPGTFKDFFDACQGNEPGATTLALVLTGFVKPEERARWKVNPGPNCAIIQTTLTPCTSYKDWPAELHFRQTDEFERAVPLEVWNRFQSHCSNLATHQLMEEYQKFLRRLCPFATPRMVERFICSQAPMIFRLPRTFGAFGFGGGEIKAAGGWADYARHDPATAVANGKRYFQMLTDNYEALLEASFPLSACGSSAGLPENLAKSIFDSLESRLANPSLNEEPVILAAQWNGTMALLGLAAQALQFRRPYPFFAPSVYDLRPNACQVVREKVGPRIIRMGPILNHLFRLAAESLPAVWKKLMPSEEMGYQTQKHCCGFFRLPLRKVVQHFDPTFRKQNIIAGISYDRTLFQYAGIFPGTMRHTADFALRQASFTDREVDILSDHSSARSRARYGSSSIDDPVAQKLHTRAESAVAKYMGIV